MRTTRHFATLAIAAAYTLLLLVASAPPLYLLVIRLALAERA